MDAGTLVKLQADVRPGAGPDEDGDLRLGETGDPGLVEHVAHAGKGARIAAVAGEAREVVEGEHRMGLAAAERGLKPKDRIAAGAGEPLRRRRQHASQALGDVGDLEELGRRRVVALGMARVDGEEVGGEFGLPGAVLDHVLVRQGDLDPGLQRLAAGRLRALGWRRQVELRRGDRRRRRRGWRRCGHAGAALRVIGGLQLGLERLRRLEQRREFDEGMQIAQRVRVAQGQVEMGDGVARIERLREQADAPCVSPCGRTCRRTPRCQLSSTVLSRP